MTDRTDDPASRPPDTPATSERRCRSLVDLARERLDVAVDTARIAGRAEVTLDVHPSPMTREAYSDADHRATLARELAHGALDALIRGR